MIKYVFTIISFLIIFLFCSLNAQAEIRGIAILDLSIKKSETNDAQLISVEHMVKVAGTNYVITSDIEAASNYSMIFCSSILGESTFTSDEKTSLILYVENGGILLAPRVEDEDLFDLFGISGFESDFARFEINWDSTSSSKALEWIDEPEEWTVSLGRSTHDEIYKTLAYTPTSAESLATFKDGSSAITQNSYGDGKAVTVGLSFKEVILRNQINRDFEAQRITSNGFEPSSDVFSLFVRGLYIEHQPYAVWKHTSPGHSASTLMITHDIDSRTGMDTLVSFVDYQFEHNIEATYNVTVRYFEDALMSSFYLSRQETLDYIQSKGQGFGSHSVGHFFDFADESIFPIGEPGNTKTSYTPFNDGDVTTGGTVFGECEVSKNELESDIGINIRTFRAGHLAFPKYLIDVLDELGYDYNSTVSASDVLTNFPYRNKKSRSFSGDVSNIYEIPVTISDVFHDDPINSFNYLNKSEIWLDVTLKNIGNGAPTALLIHPNRDYKLEGLKYYLDHLPDDIHIMEMSLFGDYWRARDTFNFNSIVEEEVLTVVIPNDEDLDNNISFVVNNGQLLNTIVVKSEDGNILNFQQENWTDNDVVLFYKDVISNTNSFVSKARELSIYPSPTNGFFNIEFDLIQSGKTQINLFNIQGEKVMQILDQNLNAGEHKWSANFSPQKTSRGIYIIVLRTADGKTIRRKIVLM